MSETTLIYNILGIHPLTTDKLIINLAYKNRVKEYFNVTKNKY